MIRNAVLEVMDSSTGYNTFTDAESLAFTDLVDCLNVVVQANGNITALRSPANFNNIMAPATSNPIQSAEYYERIAGGQVVFDVLASSSIATYTTGGTTNTQLRANQANARWHSINVNDRLYRANGTEYVQYTTGLVSATSIGITAPSAAPTVSIVSGGSLTITVGRTVSYAYINQTTQHVGEASAASADSGASTDAAKTLRTAVTASTQTGITGIVLFISANGGSLRYLNTDVNGDPIIYANSTANIDISTTIYLNLNVSETEFNVPPVAGADFFFRWRDRLCLCGYTTTTLGAALTYSGRDQIAYGQSYECWPPLNIIPIPNKSERLRCGIDTAIGALCLTDRNAYLLNGTPTDKVDSGENTLQFTEQFQQLNWNVGTRSPLTIQNAPFGTIWLDQDKHLQFWPFRGQPNEIALGLRTDLATILDTDAARAMAEARWFSTGDQAGFYVLTASTAGTTNNRMWIVTMIKKGDALFIAAGPSDIAAQCLAVSRISGVVKCLIGATDRLREILNFSTAGAGWGTQTIYCEMIAGNKIGGIFHTFATLSYAATRGIAAQVKDFDSSNVEALTPDLQDGQYLSRVNRDGIRHRLRFVFPTDDGATYQLKNAVATHGRKQRSV